MDTWQKWFAWHPVVARSLSGNELVVFEEILRRRVIAYMDGGWGWDYMLPLPDSVVKPF